MEGRLNSVSLAMSLCPIPPPDQKAPPVRHHITRICENDNVEISYYHTRRAIVAEEVGQEACHGSISTPSLRCDVAHNNS
eukprot:4184159-Amphidinium_carterae.1